MVYMFRRASGILLIVIAVTLVLGYLFTHQQNTTDLQSTQEWEEAWLNYAKIAWRYFQPGVGVNPTTGLQYANTEWHKFTSWDLAGYILAIINAEELGLLPRDGDWGADYRVGKILRFLQNRPLTEDRLPYLVYDAETGGLPPGVEAQSTNACDEGRLLTALYKLKQHSPDLAQVIDDIVSRVDYVKLALGVVANHFYDYYIARGFKFFGFDGYEPIARALQVVQKMAGDEHIEVYGERLPKVEVTSEPMLHGLLELDPQPLFKDYASRVYRVQEKRWEATGKLTAWSEGAYPVYPYYIYECIVSAPPYEGTWIIYSKGIGVVNITPVVYVKAAFGFHALYSTNYTKMLVDKLSRVLQASWVLGKGFVEGVDEEGNLIMVWTDKTNSLIINAARYALSRDMADARN